MSDKRLTISETCGSEEAVGLFSVACVGNSGPEMITVGVTAAEIDAKLSSHLVTVGGPSRGQHNLTQIVESKILASGYTVDHSYGDVRAQVFGQNQLLKGTTRTLADIGSPQAIRFNMVQSPQGVLLHQPGGVTPMDLGVKGENAGSGSGAHKTPTQLTRTVDENYSALMALPELLETLVFYESYAYDDSELSFLESLVAQTITTDNNMASQVKVDLTTPAQSQRSQTDPNSDPVTTISIGASKQPITLTDHAIGVNFTDQIVEAVTFDYVATLMMTHFKGERIRGMSRMFGTILTGDHNTTAPVPVESASLPKYGGAGDGTLTDKALWKMLYSVDQGIELSVGIMGVDDFFKVQERKGIPKKVDDPSEMPLTPTSSTYGINIANRNIPIFVLPLDENPIPAGTLMFMDPRRALARYVNTRAAFSAVERKSYYRLNKMRVDGSENHGVLEPKAIRIIDLFS